MAKKPKTSTAETYLDFMLDSESENVLGSENDYDDDRTIPVREAHAAENTSLKIAKSGTGSEPTKSEAIGIVGELDVLNRAQSRISELELEVQNLLKENEKLAAAGSTYKEMYEEKFVEVEKIRRRATDLEKELSAREKEFELKFGKQSRELFEQKKLNEKFEERIASSMASIRRRERELRNELDLKKFESQSMQSSKDQKILELKNEIDGLRDEVNKLLENKKSLVKELSKKNEVTQRVVKALKLAISQMEVEEQDE